MSSIYQQLTDHRPTGRKSFALLIDPDKASDRHLANICQTAVRSSVDYILLGGSLVMSNNLDHVTLTIRRECPIPVILFPGSPNQITSHADALLYLSLISGRNPELLIGQHVISAPMVRQSGLEVMSTGYMVIDGGAPTTVSYISHSSPIPHDKDEIAVCTAMAGEMLGMKLLYLDAGSGARRPVSSSMINAVSSHTQIPLIVGGGITDPEKAYNAAHSGADLVVIGNALEKDRELLSDLCAAVHTGSLAKQH